jgi:hypothetical protein
MQSEELFLNEAYPFINPESGLYLFDTDSKASYGIKFKPSPYIFGDDVPYGEYIYELSIYQYSHNKSAGIDMKISYTIAAIFTHFYINSDEKIFIYICDSSEGKQLVRERKFSQWIEFFMSSSYIHIKERIVDNDGTIYPVSLIIKTKNPYRTDILNAFENLVIISNK